MSPTVPDVRLAVVGAGRIADAVAAWDTEIEVEPVPPAAVDDSEFTRVDCVVVDGGVDAVDAVAAAERIERRDVRVSVVVLTDGWDAERVADAVSAGIADALPRELLEADPDALAERVVDAARRSGTSTRDPGAARRGDGPVARLHEFTERIQHAETESEVCAAVVDAAASALDLLAPACWLADGGDLRPAAGTDAAWRPDDSPGTATIDPDHPASVAHDRGEVVTADADEIAAPDRAGRAVFFPLGDDGVLGVGTAGDDAVAAAEILARHAATALERVTHRRERRDAERRFRLIADRIDEVIYLSEPDFSEVFYVNDAYEDLWNEPVETLYEAPRSFADAVDPRDRDDFDAEFRAMVDDIDDGDPDDRYVFEFRIRPTPEEVRWIRSAGYPVDTDDGTLFVGIAEEVTERRELEATYRGIFENASDGLVVHHPETGEICDVNDRFCEMNGYDRAELVGETVDAVTPPDLAYEDARERIRAADREGPQLFEWRNQRADGETFPVEVHLGVVEIRGEERVLASVRDISERRRTERRLSEVLDRIDEAVHITTARNLTTAEGHPDYLSSGYEEIWGQPLDDIRERYDRGFFDTLHPDDRAAYRGFIEDLAADVAEGTAADSDDIDYRIERPDGETRWVNSEFYPIEWGDGPPRVVIVSRDVTDRKARERRIASFDDATEDLTTADSPSEAAESAVAAAREELELPAVGAFLYDDADGLLRPEATAGPLPDGLVGPIEPGDGRLWEAFATGTALGPAATDDPEPDGLSALASWRALPLGSHGVLVVGSPEGSFGSGTVQTAHVLAATLEAAVAHLRGRQRVADRERALRTQTERADRLDRIARLARRVGAALTDATTPAEVERAVCDRLATSGPYDLAWIGGVAVGSDRLTPRAVAGESERYVDDLRLTTADDADPHPAVVAWQAGEARVADSLVGAGPDTEWRRRALAAGYQSMCAVPLRHDGVTHGVLVVGTDAPNAVGDRELETLSQLGCSIANALAAIERRRALESDETVELEFRGPGESLPFACAAAAAGCRVSLRRTVAGQEGPVSVYFRFEGDVPDDAPAVARRTLPGSVEVVADDETTLVEVRTDEWFGAPLASHGGMIRSASADPETATITVEVPVEADVRSFADRLSEVAPSLELVAKRQHGDRDRTPTELGGTLRETLTDRQLEALRTAVSAGYFEWPRENDGSEVADRLGITQPTFNKHLRVAERETFELLFGDG